MDRARARVVKAHSRLFRAQTEVQLLGLETLNWGADNAVEARLLLGYCSATAGTLVTAAMEAEQLKGRRRQ